MSANNFRTWPSTQDVILHLILHSQRITTLLPAEDPACSAASSARCSMRFASCRIAARSAPLACTLSARKVSVLKCLLSLLHHLSVEDKPLRMWDHVIWFAKALWFSISWYLLARRSGSGSHIIQTVTNLWLKHVSICFNICFNGKIWVSNGLQGVHSPWQLLNGLALWCVKSMKSMDVVGILIGHQSEWWLRSGVVVVYTRINFIYIYNIYIIMYIGDQCVTMTDDHPWDVFY